MSHDGITNYGYQEAESRTGVADQKEQRRIKKFSVPMQLLQNVNFSFRQS
jgi:hypothetical protein